MKKTAVIVGILLIFIAGYFYFNKPMSIAFRGAEGLHVNRISKEALEIQGNLIFHNPNKTRANLGKVDVKVYVENEEVGVIHDEFKEAIKGGENFPFSFQVRFPLLGDWHKATIPDSLRVFISGSAGSDVLFANYTFPIEYSGTIKNAISDETR